MENKQLITLGARNKSISKLKATVHLQNQQTEPCYTSRVPTQPHPISQPFRLIQTLQSKENLSTSTNHMPRPPGQLVSILRENPALSHQNFYMSSPQSRIVESKEKTRTNLMMETVYAKTSQGSPVNQSNSRSKIVVQNESNKNLLTLTLNQNAKQVQLMSKIKMLQQVLSQKQAEHQHLQSIIMHERNENQNLVKKNHQIIRENDENKLRILELEEMLERQISKSLDLMDNGESFSKEIEDIRAQILVKDTLVRTLEQELKISHERMTNTSNDIETMKKDFNSKVMRITIEMQQIKKDRELRIKELESKLHSIECELLTSTQQSSQKDSLIGKLEKEQRDELQRVIVQSSVKVNELSQTINIQTTEIVSLRSQIQSLNKSQSRWFSSSTHEKLQTQPENASCKKCKQLLQTVFKLNSHLNKK